MNVDVKDLVGVAGSTIGLIIACSIFAGNVSGKFGAMYQRFEALQEERREKNPTGQRRKTVRNEIETYLQRIRITRQASEILSFSLLCFLSTVVFSCLSVVYKDAEWAQWGTIVGLAIGLVLMAIAAVMQLVENHLLRKTIDGTMVEMNKAWDPKKEEKEAKEKDQAARAGRQTAPAHG